LLGFSLLQYFCILNLKEWSRRVNKKWFVYSW